MFRNALTCLLALSFLPAASAAISITDVVNAASRIGSGLPGAGIAQGSIFVVTGAGVGPDQLVQASFPLPTSDGLGGVSMKIAVGGATLDAIMVYAKSNEVAAILPSKTPLGTGTITVNNNGATATAPIVVVKSAFGIFTAASGAGPALAFNVAGDGTVSANGYAQAAQGGQTVTINGTGLGAIASDETQSGVTDVPAADIKVFVGTLQAAVVSAGRGTCCAGLDPNFPIPPGVAGWDVITFTVPAGISGCSVSLVVQIGNVVSNFGTFSVADSGSCIDLSAVPGDLINLSGTIKTGLVLFTRVSGKTTVGASTTSTLTDAAAATFSQVDVGPDPEQVPVQLYATWLSRSAGSCIVTVARTSTTPTAPVTPVTPVPPVTPPVILDAGPLINIKVPSPSVTKAMLKQKGGTYSAADTIINVPLPGGLPPIVSGGPDFLPGGPFVLENGAGGADIGAFSLNLKNPGLVSWDNADQIPSITRGQPITVKWSGGDPAGYVTIGGVATRIQTGVVYYGQFTCIEHADAGTFTVPGFVTQNFPVTDSTSIVPQGSLLVSSDNFQFITIPGVDIAEFFSTSSTVRLLQFQ